jgi:TolA-binding protein
MNCQAISRDDLIEKYLNRRLDPATEDEFELHIFDCSRCARLLELFQTVHADLTQRAHEIRLQTPGKRLLFRWEAAAFASLLLIAGLAGVAWNRNAKKLSVTLRTEPQKAANSGLTTSSVPLESESISHSLSSSQTLSEKQPDQESHRTDARHDKIINEMVRSLSTAQSGEQPPPVPPPANEQIPAARDNGPEIASNSKANSDEVGNQTRLTVKEGVELYRLGMMQAPPYTFSGLVGGEKIPDTHGSSAYSPKGLPSGAGRAMFQNAMNAYIDGRYKEAVDFLEHAAQLEPTAPDINFYLGVCNLLAGRPRESIAPLTNAAAAGNSPYLQSSHYYLAKAYIQSIKLAEAESELRDAIAVPGRLTADANVLLTRLQALRGQIEK